IVFRKGSAGLAALIEEEVTHGGLYLGNGVLHDVVGFGNRCVKSTLFFSTEKGEVADPNVVKVVRFTGPLNDLIVPRVLSNVAKKDYWLPSDPKPWNLFSTADDYRTATCLRQTYFKPGAQGPAPLISPKKLTLVGSATGGIGSGGGWGAGGTTDTMEP